LTAPNPQAQSELLVSAYRDAGVDPKTITYIEAHGTGTSLGDPIEISGLQGAFETLYEDWGHPSADQAHCAIGTVKTNVGHLESAAGLVGIVKVLLALKHKTIPGNIHFNELNPVIDIADSPFYIAVERTGPFQIKEIGQAITDH